MEVNIQRMHCVQMPEIAIIGVGLPDDYPAEYLVHAQHMFSYLLQKPSRQTTSAPMAVYFKSETGNRMKNGGNLKEAYRIAPLTSEMYTHHIGRNGNGSPSLFLTVDGVRKIVKTLPNQDEDARRNFINVFEECIKNDYTFKPATQEQCANDNDENDGEIFTEGCGGGNPTAQEDTLITPNGMYDIKIAFIQSEAEKKYLQEKLTLEEDRRKIEKNNLTLTAEKDKAEMELKTVKEQAETAKTAAQELKDRDLAIVKLTMQLEFEKEKAKMQAEFSKPTMSDTKKRTPDDYYDDTPSKHTKAQTLSKGISSSPKLTLLPFSDDKAFELHKGRKYRWLIAYSADKALRSTDFGDEASRTISIIGSNKLWVSLIYLLEKKTQGTMIKRLEELHSAGRIRDKAAIEAVQGGNIKLQVEDVQEDDTVGAAIRQYMHSSPSIVEDEDQPEFIKMRVVIE